MINYRTRHLIQLVCYLGYKSGAFSIKLKRKTFILTHCKKRKKTIIANAVLDYIWVISCIYFTIQEILHGKTNEIILKILFTLFVLTLSVVLSIPVNFGDDLVLLLNRLFGFLCIIESKLSDKKSHLFIFNATN